MYLSVIHGDQLFNMRKFFTLSLAILAFSKLYSQTLPEQIQTYFDTYQAEYPVEKAYLHLDKSVYTLGEDVWFSTYVTAGSSQIPSPLSKPLYVDLFDGNGLLLESKLIRLEEGRGDGNFTLPNFGIPGIYQIKAYTSWMKNFGEEYFYEGEITVVDGGGGSFLPKVDFLSIESSNGKTRYTVELTGVDKNGSALANEKLELKAMEGENELHSQDVLLNQDGEASFSFEINSGAYSSQRLELTFLEGGTYPVTQSVQLPYSLVYADIQFLPESGRWLTGKKSQMAFRGIYPDGSPVILEGKVTGAQDVTFKSNFAGLGKFEMTPDQTDYSAEIKESSTGETRIVDLPKVSDTGVMMQLVNNPAASYVTAFVQGIGDFGELLLVSQTRGIINYMIQGQLSNGVWGVRIPKENLVTGINQVSVLQIDGTPLLERLMFFSGGDALDLALDVNGDLGKRSKLAVEISNNGPVLSRGTFSLSVVDAGQVELSGDESNIFSSLLISSDLKGKLHFPGRYFSSEDGPDLEAIDLVMLTHGWTRFDWEGVLSSNYPKIESFIERGINIEGQITDSEDTRKGLSGGNVNAIIGEGIEIITTEYGPNGRFILTEMDYLDTATVTITAEDKRLKTFIDVEVIKPEPIFQSLPGAYPAEIAWPEALTATVQERKLQAQMQQSEEDYVDLEGVTVESQTIQKEQVEQRKIYGAGDVTIEPTDIPSAVAFQNVFQLLQGRVSGVQVTVAGLQASVQIRGPGSVNSGTEPLYLLDNIPVDAQTLLQVNLADVQSVDVFKDPAKAAIFGAQGANGVIAVYLKQGGSRGISVGGTLVTKYGGYTPAKEFYQPMYDEDPLRQALDDKRATIFWKGIIETDADGKASLEYYNNDISTKQILILEGMDSEGRLGRAVKVIGN